MFRDISVRFSRKVIIVSFILSVFVMYIHAKNLAYYDFGDAHGTLIFVLNQIMSETFGRESLFRFSFCNLAIGCSGMIFITKNPMF